MWDVRRCGSPKKPERRGAGRVARREDHDPREILPWEIII
jgi:hypothetical protein